MSEIDVGRMPTSAASSAIDQFLREPALAHEPAERVLGVGRGLAAAAGVRSPFAFLYKRYL